MIYQLEESKEKITVLVSVGSLKKQGRNRRAAAGVRAAKSSESRKGE